MRTQSLQQHDHRGSLHDFHVEVRKLPGEGTVKTPEKTDQEGQHRAKERGEHRDQAGDHFRDPWQLVFLK